MALLTRLSPSRIASRRIVRFSLSNYFTVVELDDGSVGACMSYATMSRRGIAEMGTWLDGVLHTDPLLQEVVSSIATDNLMLLSLKASIISALSESALVYNIGADVTISTEPYYDPLDGASTALVVGFGGYMALYAADPRIQRLHITDLQYGFRAKEMERTVHEYRTMRPTMTVTISDGRDGCQRAQEADVVAVTGSALCNGTMEQLLACASGRRVIVQGPSAAIHPGALFLHGVNMVVTTRMPRGLIEMAGRGELPRIMEDDLPWVYLHNPALTTGQGTGPR